ncbi:MAG: hypothetical protein ACKVQJ_01280 [Pyrinomonadaceae bacterium]
MKHLLLPFLAFSIVLSISGQERLRTIQTGYEPANPPIEFVGWETGGRPFLSLKQVKAGNDWWKSLMLTVRNKTQKTIAYLDIHLLVPKQGQMPSQIGMPLYVRAREDLSGSGKNPRWLGPGETIQMEVRNFAVVSLSERLNEYGITDFDWLTVYLSQVYFDDGTGWSHGKDIRFESSHSADSSQKKIEKVWIGGNEPVEIVNIRANGKQTVLDQVFKADGNWLKDLRLNIRNISDRPINRILCYLSVLQSKPIGPPTGFPIEIKTSSFGVGNTFEEVFDQYDLLKKAFSYTEDITLRNTAQIRIAEVNFADGTKWQNGSFFKPDPDKLGEFILDNERYKRNPMKK